MACMRSSAKEIIRPLAGTQLVASPWQHSHAHSALCPEVSRKNLNLCGLQLPDSSNLTEADISCLDEFLRGWFVSGEETQEIVLEHLMLISSEPSMEDQEICEHN